MDRDYIEEFERALLGRRCRIERREADWAANLDGGGSIALPVPWRIVAKGRIAFADGDDGQKFGLPAPVDGESVANELLAGKAITRVVVDRQTADLTLTFEGDIRLDVFNYSSGYEGWQATLPPGPDGMLVIALGGGEVTVFA